MRNIIISYNLQQVGRIISGLILILLPVFSSHKFLIEESNYCVLAIVVIMALTLIFTFSEIRLQFTLSDVFVLCTAVWITFDTFVLHDRIISDERISLWIALFIVYIVGRIHSNYPEHLWLYVSLALAGTVQAFIAWMQYAGIWASNHPSFEVTGSFLNPAPLGAFLGISLYAYGKILYYLYSRKQFYPFGLGILLLFAVGSMFILSFSRASWVAFFLSGILFFALQKGFKFSRKTYCTLLILCLIGIVSLYHLKKESADGRLFIWTVGMEMIKQSPLTGKGASSFAANYMPAQAEYLAANPDSRYAENATVNIYAFNEYLRIACEYGLIGLMLVTALLVSALCSPVADPYIKSMFFYLCVYSFFSYTSEVQTLFVLFVFLIAFLPGKVLGTYSLHKKPLVQFVCLLSGLLIISVSLLRYKEVVHVSKLIRSYAEEGTDTLRLQLETCTSKHYYNRTYVLGYARQLYQNGLYSEALPYLRQAIYLSPTPEMYIDMGNSLFYLHKYEEAEKYFSAAVNMVPGRILPRYYLFRLYVDAGNETRAYALGKEIMQRNYKQEGTVVMKAKYHVRKYLQEKSFNSQ